MNESGEVLGKASKKVGVRNTAIDGNNKRLKEGLKEIFNSVLKSADRDLSEIEFIVSSGMITSEIGLLEIPHIWAPANIDCLSTSIYKVHDTSVFPIDIPIYFIRGIKNKYDPSTTQVKDVGLLDFMRGEEAQVAGLISSYDLKFPVTVIILSSHTKFISIDNKQNILGSITTISGQMYEAIVKETFIGKSIRNTDAFDETDYLDYGIIDVAFEWVTTSGFLRTMLMPRFLDTLLKTKWYERRLFVHAAIATEDMRAMNQFESLGFPHETDYVLVGENKRCSLYEYLLKKKLPHKKNILKITSEVDIDRLTINGSFHIAKKAGLL
ncbi:MAG: 2-dehydro-3-deoxygalactonokinase [Spirochaetes bacterium]|nr:2-dehydro-3-deoxygalactonokinase [Spirochaetota bacterium]